MNHFLEDHFTEEDITVDINYWSIAMKNLNRRDIRFLVEGVMYDMHHDLLEAEGNQAAKNKKPQNKGKGKGKGKGKKKSSPFMQKVRNKLSKEQRQAFRKKVKEGFGEMREDPKAFFKGETGQKVEDLLDTVAYALNLFPLPGPAKALGVAAIAASIVIDIYQGDILGIITNVLLLTPRFFQLTQQGVFGEGIKKGVKKNKTAQSMKKFLKGEIGKAAKEGAKKSASARGALGLSNIAYSDKKIKEMTISDLEQASQILSILSKASLGQASSADAKERIDAQLAELKGDSGDDAGGSEEKDGGDVLSEYYRYRYGY